MTQGPCEHAGKRTRAKSVTDSCFVIHRPIFETAGWSLRPLVRFATHKQASKHAITAGSRPTEPEVSQRTPGPFKRTPGSLKRTPGSFKKDPGVPPHPSSFPAGRPPPSDRPAIRLLDWCKSTKVENPEVQMVRQYGTVLKRVVKRGSFKRTEGSF